MTYINVNVNDAQEVKPAPKGRYELQITGTTPGVTGPNSKNPGAPTIKVSCGFTDLDLNAGNVTHFITLPNEFDEPGALKFKKLLLSRFLNAFGVSVSDEGFDVDELAMDMIGHTANIEVGLTEPNDNGDIFNTLILPKLKEEVVGGRGKAPKRRGE